MGTGGWHWLAQVGGTTGQRWAAQVGTLLGTGGFIAGHRWAETCVWHCWAPIIRALMISDPDDWCRSLL
ncbi:unnamed protein product [Staurois parvus]|uniref:Uncharacterized protein n=1 Tax=Staurois parvus TaxID=386267 RepID=A0ABN9AI39_9NEOB|nr:unnamed protein product [Staurois parvus]